MLTSISFYEILKPYLRATWQEGRLHAVYNRLCIVAIRCQMHILSGCRLQRYSNEIREYQHSVFKRKLVEMRWKSRKEIRNKSVLAFSYFEVHNYELHTCIFFLPDIQNSYNYFVIVSFPIKILFQCFWNFFTSAICNYSSYLHLGHQYDTILVEFNYRFS